MSAGEEFRKGVEDTIRRRRLLKGGERVVVAVSGGPDSVALLAVLRELAPAWGLELHVAHFDHRLREGSGRDAAYVGGLARRLDLPATIGSAPAGPRPAGLSPEEAARERRLRFLEDVADSAGGETIATGHTLDDQAETLVLRLAVGAGARGLGGIPPLRGRFVRPLIDRRRRETAEYCRRLGLRPRRDPTNDDLAVPRNAVRRRVIPLLEGLNPRAADNLARTADLIREEDAFLDELASSALVADARDGCTRFDRDDLLALPMALRRRALRLAFPSPPPDAATIDRILDLASGGRSGDAIDVAQGLNARLEYGSLLLGRAPFPAPTPEPVTLAVPGSTELSAWGAAMTVWLESTSPNAWPDGKTTCVVDADRLKDSLVLRSPRRGDRMTPLGMTGSRSVADIIGEAKITRGDRDRVPVVSAGDMIVWVVGHRLDDRAKVREGTTRHLWLRFEGGLPWGS